ncbi:MAG: diguanylate cyclase [Thauera sp.]|nr:diguanylate cyclase [Thauera sp.]
MPSRPLSSPPLRLVLIVPYVVLVIALAIAIGMLSYAAGSRAVSTVSEHLLREAVGRIAQAVDRHIVGSAAVLEAAFPDGMSAPRSVEADFDALRTRFWIATSLHTDPNNYVYYGNEAGQGFGLFRHSATEAELRVKLAAADKRTIYRFTGIDGPLRRERQEDKLFDPRSRPWYADGKRTSGHTWTSVYIDFGTLQLVATRARRVLSANGSFEGVVATDVSLQALNDFVSRLRVSAGGIAYIIENDGSLIASSASPNVTQLPEGGSERLKAGQSAHPVLKATYETVRSRLAATGARDQPQVFDFCLEDGSRIHVAYDRLRDAAGLDWIMVVAMPSSDFLGGVLDNVIRTVVLATLAVLLAVVIGLRILGWVSGDLSRLSDAARRIGDGDLYASVGVARKDEIGHLARSFEAMQNRLRTDRLTGLANRDAALYLLRKRIEQARKDRRRPQVGVLFIDLNGFKQINDRFGHAAGDRALQEIGERLQGSVRAEDFVARYAGDEFVIVVDHEVNRDVLEHVRDHVSQALRRPLASLGNDVPASAGGAIGMALFPDNGDDAETLIKHADRAMYIDKLGTRNTPHA